MSVSHRRCQSLGVSASQHRPPPEAACLLQWPPIFLGWRAFSPLPSLLSQLLRVSPNHSGSPPVSACLRQSLFLTLVSARNRPFSAGRRPSLLILSAIPTGRTSQQENTCNGYTPYMIYYIENVTVFSFSVSY